MPQGSPPVANVQAALIEHELAERYLTPDPGTHYSLGRFTVGFEVEVVVMPKTVLQVAHEARRDIVSDETMERDVYAYIHQKCHSIGVGANIYIPDPTGHGPDYSVWNITSDNSIETNTSSMESSPQAPALFRVGVELISPIFVFNDDGWPSIVRRVFGALNEMHWRPNRSTGLHVHVGSRYRPFTLEEVKEIAKYVLVFEGKETHPERSFICTRRIRQFCRSETPSREHGHPKQSEQ